MPAGRPHHASPPHPTPPHTPCADVVEDNQEEASQLVLALLEANGLELLVDALTRLDEGVQVGATHAAHTTGCMRAQRGA